jgi:hypothetical protein
VQIAIITVFIIVLAVLILARLRQSSAPSPVSAKVSAPAAKTPRASAAVPNSGTAKPAVAKPVNNIGNPFRAVSIKAGTGPCAAVKALQDERFLIGTVPHIPLADCGSKSCTCKYVHHEDRRLPDDERRAPAALTTNLYAATGRADRRARERGRRQTD